MAVKQIRAFPKYYISDLGRVFSVYSGKTKQLKPQLHNGYPSVTLCRDKIKYQFLVHRLVLFHFKGLPLLNECANHKNGNKLNNGIKNLEWTTQSRNVKHAYKKKLRTINKEHKERCAALGLRKRKLTIHDAEKIRRLFVTGLFTKTTLASMFSINRKGILQIINKETYKET